MTEIERGGRGRLSWIGAGALLALTLHLLHGARAVGGEVESPPRRVQYWVADRDGDRVFGLDDRLLLRTRITVRRPLRVLARIDGGAWILHAHGRREEPHGLQRVDEWGVVQAATSLGEVRDAALVGGRDLLLLEQRGRPGSAVRLLRIDAQGRSRPLLEAVGLSSLAVQGQEVLLGRDDGALLRFALEEWTGPTVLRGQRRPSVLPGARADELDEAWTWPCVGEPLVALAPARRDEARSEGTRGATEWWMLSGSVDRRLTRLDRELRPRASTRLELDARTLVPDRQGRTAWLADDSRPKLVQVDSRGHELLRREVSLAGLGRGTLTPDGALLWTAPGAVLQLDEQGRSRPGQGGFEFLVDVSSVPARN